MTTAAGAKVKVNPMVDRMASMLICDLTTNQDKSENHPGIRYATHVVQVAGAQFSYGFVGVPVNTFGYEQAPTVALQSRGPAGRTKMGTRARIKYYEPATNYTVDLLAGYVVKYDHNLNEDSCVATIFDDRWVLGKVTCFGRATFDPETGQHYHDASQPLIFNRDGMQDCIEMPGGAPRFAPQRRYGMGMTADGLGTESEPAPGSADAKKMARSWRATDIMKYLRDMHYGYGNKPQLGANYGNMNVSPYMSWPSGMGNDSYFNRVPRHFEAENHSLLDVLQRLCRYAGPFDLYMTTRGFYSVLGMVRIDVHSYGQYLTLPQYRSDTIEAAMGDSSVIQGGNVSESMINYFTDVCIAGDVPAVERFIHTNIYDAETPPETTSELGLDAAWSKADQDAFNLMVTLNGDNKQAFLKACDAFPTVYAAYRIKAGAKIWPDGSKWQASNAVRGRFLQTLLTSTSQGGTNPRDWDPLQVNLEWYDATAKEWTGATRLDGLALAMDQNYLMFDALRREKLYTLYHDGYKGDSMGPNDVRLSVAVKSWFRTTARESGDPNRTSYRVQNNGNRFTYLALGEDRDYVDWERKSQPLGDLVEEPMKTQNFPDKLGNGNELFTDKVRMQRHAEHRLEDVKRLDYAGSIVLQRWNPGIKPGDQVTINGGGIVPKAAVRSVTYDATNQQQVIELCAADNSSIYDVPTGGKYMTPVANKPPANKPQPASGGDDMEKENYEREMAKADSKYAKADASKGAAGSGGSAGGSGPTAQPAATGGTGGAESKEIMKALNDFGPSPKNPDRGIRSQAQMDEDDKKRVQQMNDRMNAPKESEEDKRERKLAAKDEARKSAAQREGNKQGIREEE